MIELFPNVREQVKETADTLWVLASSINNPLNASQFLEHATNYYSYLYTEEEIAFLQFYINMKMEEMNNGSNINTER